MASLNFRKFFARNENRALVEEFWAVTPGELPIFDLQRTLVLGNGAWEATAVPILCNLEPIGWVGQGKGATFLAKLIGQLMERELERKSLASETLEKYRELNLFYSVASRLGSCLQITEVTQLVLQEAQKLIACDHASVMLLDQESQYLSVLEATGTEYFPKVVMQVGQGIAGNVLRTGVAEIVNNTAEDPRFVPGGFPIASLICAPLKTQDKILGVFNLSTTDPNQYYRAADLKLFSALVAQAAAAIENALLHQQKIREERIKSNLERYLAPQLVSAIIGDTGGLSLNTQRSTITMLFSDIRNFTHTCEQLEPEAIVDYLNEYFTHMVSVIFHHQGTVNKFVGDMIVAMFGAPAFLPDSEAWAIKAAIAMQQCLRSVSIPWIREHFLTGIGINTGDVVVGNIGSPQHMDYTAIGDEMNVASRLQSIATGGQILISRRVYEITEHLFSFREHGTITVKGKQNSIEVYEVLY